MGSFGHSSNIPRDFEFKNIPEVEFQKVIKQVESDMKRKKSIETGGRRQIGMWGNYCTVSPMDESENEESENFSSRTTTANSDVHTVYVTPKRPNASTFVAPLFGPPRRIDIEELKKSRVPPSSNSRNSKKTGKSSHNSSVHIDKKANAADVQKKLASAKNQVPQKITANDADDVGWYSSDNDETLHSEMLELCNQIENVNGSNSSSLPASSSSSPTNRNSNQRTMQLLKNIMNKTESVSEKKYSSYVDKKFDFRYENEDESNVEQSFSEIVEPQVTAIESKMKKKKNKNSGDDSSNNNNVYIPKMPNQMSKIEQQQRQRHCEENSNVKTKRTVASPNESLKAQSVVVSDVFVNEKSQVAESAVMVKKALAYIEKICQYLGRLHEIINEPPQLEDMSDLNKRQQRAIEFINRFARNHLYQIGRMAEELRLMPDNPMDVATKVNLLFQAIMQAIQTYLKNVEMFIYNSNPDKLFVLVDFIINASKICFDRNVFDKKDAVIVKMLRKSMEMKRFLEMNQRSVAKFESTSKLRPRLQSRNSYAYGNMETNEKYAIYGTPASKEMKPKRSVGKSRNNPFGSATKSPYNIPPLSSEKSTKQNLYSTRQRGVPPSTLNTPAMKTLSPGVRKSISNVSTMVQREKQQAPACEEEIEEKSGKTEKPLEESKVVGMEKTDVSEIIEMLRNVAKDKIREIIAPYIAELVPKCNEKLPIPMTTTRVTASVKPKKPSTTESSDSSKTANSHATVQSAAQYTLEKSKNESEETLKALPSEEKPSLFALTVEEEPSSQLLPEVPKTKIVTSTLKPPPLKSDDIAQALEVDDSDDDFDVLDNETMEALKETALKERKAYREAMNENSLYSNDQYGEPWKKFESISERLIDEMLMNIISEFDLGEKCFVEKFFQQELAS